jgi:hypothetical protein
LKIYHLSYKQITKPDDDDDDEEEEEEEEEEDGHDEAITQKLTSNTTIEHSNILQCFVECNSGTHQQIWKTIPDMQNYIFQEKEKNCEQSMLGNFFSRNCEHFV